MARGKGAGRAALAATAALALALGLISPRALDGADAVAQAAPSTKAPNLSKRLLLRLHDLPPGYGLLFPVSLEAPRLYTLGCAPIEPADPEPRLASFLRRYAPRGCSATYYRLFGVPDGGPAPPLVGSAAADLGSVEGAEAGLTVARELLAHLMEGELPEEAPPPEVVGEATRLFRWHQPGLLDLEPETVSVVVWRWGARVGLVLTADEQAAASDAAAFELARRQQRHLEAPTPYVPAEYDDREVALEDPALPVPVLWLGRIFSPGQGLPRLWLAQSDSVARGYPREPRVTLLYVDRPNLERAEATRIDTWTRHQWRQQREELPPFSLSCRKTRRLDLPRGHAVLYRGVEPGFACRSPRRRFGHVAVVHVEGVVLVIQTLEFCENCFGAADGRYNSFRGMATLARGLERRLPLSAAPASTPQL